MALAQLHHDVQKIHAVQFQLFAKWLLVIKIVEIFVGRNVIENVQ